MTTTKITLPTNESEDILRKTSRVQKVFEWDIKNFFNLPIQSTDGLDGPTFEIFGLEWNLRIYPYGLLEEGWISLFLRKRTETVVDVWFTLGIKSADGSAFISHDMKKKYSIRWFSHGTKKLIERSELLNSRDDVVPRNVLTVFCAFHLEVNVAASNDEASQTSGLCGYDMLSTNFKELYLSGSEGDMKITVQGKEFISHKAVLTARCPVFRSMLEADMAEKNSGAVNIDDCDPDCFHNFLLFLYSGELDLVSSHNAVGLYYIADKYDVKQLKEACRVCMTREITVDSVCDIVQLASLHNEPELLDSASNFFAHNTDSIITTPKWMSFLVEHPDLANELFVSLTSKYKFVPTK